MKSVEEILNEAFKCHKSAKIHFENGNYMAWQQLLTKEKTLLWCIDMEKKYDWGDASDERKNSR